MKKGFIVYTVSLLVISSICHSIYLQVKEPTAQAEEAFTPAPSGGKLLLKAPTTGFKGRPVKTETLILRKDNMVLFRDEVGALSVAKAQKALLDMDESLSKNEHIILVLDTPGGDIFAGSQLVGTVKSLKHRVDTLSIFAASMGFFIVQALDTRYVFPSGTLMAHRARVGQIAGQVPGEAVTALATAYEAITEMERSNASRLGISFDDYTTLVKDEYWVTGSRAVEDNAADKIALVRCDESLKGTYTQEAQTLFGSITLTWENCPAVTAPVGVSYGEGTDKGKIAPALSSYQKLRSILVH